MSRRGVATTGSSRKEISMSIPLSPIRLGGIPSVAANWLPWLQHMRVFQTTLLGRPKSRPKENQQPHGLRAGGTMYHFYLLLPPPETFCLFVFYAKSAKPWSDISMSKMHGESGFVGGSFLCKGLEYWSHTHKLPYIRRPSVCGPPPTPGPHKRGRTKELPKRQSLVAAQMIWRPNNNRERERKRARDRRRDRVGGRQVWGRRWSSGRSLLPRSQGNGRQWEKQQKCCQVCQKQNKTAHLPGSRGLCRRRVRQREQTGQIKMRKCWAWAGWRPHMLRCILYWGKNPYNSMDWLPDWGQSEWATNTMNTTKSKPQITPDLGGSRQ